jgi:superfamily I DNA and/or RNA helicase
MPEKSFKIYLKGEDKTDNVSRYRRIGDKYEVTFNNGKLFAYNASNVRIVASALNAKKPRDCFEYLKCIAAAVGLKEELESGKIINILENAYAKIDFVLPDSLLDAFLSGKLPEAQSAKPFDPVIYPFGFNASQKDAVERSLSSRLSIIEGPPGTGKTQTILNSIANIVMRGESVAVVSSNNSATKNVLEKLEKYGVDFIAAYLGNTENKRAFISTQKPLPDMNKWVLEAQTIAELRRMLKSRYEALHKKLARQNELSVLKQELSELETERGHFLQYFENVLSNGEPQAIRKIENAEKALDMWLRCEVYEESSRGKGIIAFIKIILERLGFFGRRRRELCKLLKQYPCEQLIASYQRQFYELKIAELTQSVSTLTHELEAFDFNAKMREYSMISARLFRGKLAEQYTAHERGAYELDDLWRNSRNFIKDYPVILSTTYSIRSSLSSRVMYDYVIIDESSQVDLCTGALALSCARKAVVVGDLKQLPNVVDRKASAITDDIFTKFDLPDVYRYKNHSLLSAATELFPNAPSTLLREHYRCHPKIIEFCNKKFYGGRLLVLTEPKSGREPLLVYKTVEGNHERNRVNQRQIDIIKNEIIPQQNLNITDGSVGIVTPYRNQTNALQRAFTKTGVKAGTVDKFQGQENDVIILSTVDNTITEFADNANRLNVAVSRAIEQLIVVVSDGDAQTDTNIGDLIRYIEYNNFSIINSKIYSVFDYLYKSYSERRRQLLVKQKRVSEYDSENLMYALIQSVLKDERFSCFDVAVHVPLKMIVRDTHKLSTLEKRYAGNILTHVDFLVFDTIGKSPRLVVEVDGSAFHAAGSYQSERDSMKNEILKKYGLPIARFRTDGSNERSRLLVALDATLGNSRQTVKQA